MGKDLFAKIDSGFFPQNRFDAICGGVDLLACQRSLRTAESQGDSHRFFVGGDFFPFRICEQIEQLDRVEQGLLQRQNRGLNLGVGHG